jgi:hypothetical protein
MIDCKTVDKSLTSLAGHPDGSLTFFTFRLSGYKRENATSREVNPPHQCERDRVPLRALDNFGTRELLASCIWRAVPWIIRSTRTATSPKSHSTANRSRTASHRAQLRFKGIGNYKYLIRLSLSITAALSVCASESRDVTRRSMEAAVAAERTSSNRSARHKRCSSVRSARIIQLCYVQPREVVVVYRAMTARETTDLNTC